MRTWVGLALALALTSGCHQQAAVAGPKPSPPSPLVIVSPSASAESEQNSVHEPFLSGEGRRLRTRFLELEKEGRGPDICSELERDVLVQNAPALFEHRVRLGSLHLYSDRPFRESDGLSVLRGVEAKLSASPLYDPDIEHAAFLCHDAWREQFFLAGRKLGGLNTWPVSHNVFLTQGSIAKNALLSPRGRPIAPPRTLDYYIAHEFTHTLLGLELGKPAWDRLPDWIFEGYPDWIGLGPDYSYAEALAAYRSRPDVVQGTLAEDYLRYDVQIGHFLEREGLTIHQLLKLQPEPPAL